MMQNTVHKFTVPLKDEPTEVSLPRLTTILFVAVQNDWVTVWYERPMEEVFAKPYEPRLFQVYGTGHPIPTDATHVGSVINMPLVWHVYERNVPIESKGE